MPPSMLLPPSFLSRTTLLGLSGSCWRLSDVQMPRSTLQLCLPGSCSSGSPTLGTSKGSSGSFIMIQDGKSCCMSGCLAPAGHARLRVHMRLQSTVKSLVKRILKCCKVSWCARP